MTVDDAKKPAEAAKKLHAACRAGKATAVKKAIATGVDLECVDPAFGTTPLGSAAMAGKTDIMRILIDAGADVHGPDLQRPPLFAAAFGRWVDAVRMLLDAGVDPNMRSNNNVGILYPAIRNRADEVVKLLVERGARIDDGNGALNIAEIDSTDHAADRELFTQLIGLGAHVDAHGPDGWTALMSAARKGFEGDARFLLAKGADAALKNARGQTALALAQAERNDCLVSGHRMPPKLDRVIALLGELGNAPGA